MKAHRYIEICMLCVHFLGHKNLECCITVSTLVTQLAANMVDFFSLMSRQYFCGLSKRCSRSQQRLSARWQAIFLATCAPHIVCRLTSSLDSGNTGPFIFPRTVSHPNLVKCRAKAGAFALTESKLEKKKNRPLFIANTIAATIFQPHVWLLRSVLCREMPEFTVHGSRFNR